MVNQASIDNAFEIAEIPAVVKTGEVAMPLDIYNGICSLVSHHFEIIETKGISPNQPYTRRFELLPKDKNLGMEGLVNMVSLVYEIFRYEPKFGISSGNINSITMTNHEQRHIVHFSYFSKTDTYHMVISPFKKQQ